MLSSLELKVVDAIPSVVANVLCPKQLATSLWQMKRGKSPVAGLSPPRNIS